MGKELKERFLNAQEEIRICSGAGCRAWSAEKIARGLEEFHAYFGGSGYKVCQVPCMRKCGGGASIQITSCNGIQKFRNPEDALDILIPERMVSSVVA